MSLSKAYKNELKQKAAYYYYKKNMKLVDIADLLNVSRITMGKILKDAVDEGYVRIEVVDKENSISIIELEDKVRERFGLKMVKIVNPILNDSSYAMNEIAMAAAEFIDNSIQNRMKISLSWGRTSELMVNYLKGNNYVKDVEVYTLLGMHSMLIDQMQPNTLAHYFLQKYNGVGYVMNVPLLCETPEIAEVFMKSKEVEEIIDRSKDSDLTVLGIGGVPDETVGEEFRRFEYDVLKGLKPYNVCGSLNSNFIDIYGNVCDAEICRRFVSVKMPDIHKHKMVIGIGGGSHKVSSILGLMNGHHIRGLITDKDTIVSVLDLADRLGV